MIVCTMVPFFFLMKIFTVLALYLSVNLTLNFLPALTLEGDLTFLSGLANVVVNFRSPPLDGTEPSGLVATTRKW